MNSLDALEDRSCRTVSLRHRTLLLIVLTLLGAGLLPACGGGHDSDPAVTNLAATSARFSRAATVTVNGRNLKSGIVVRTEGGCENLTLVTNGSDDTQQYTCDVLGVGELQVIVETQEGRFLGRLAFQVPQPQVSITTSKGVITMELDAAKSPLTARNFLNYIASGFYRNTLVDSAIPDKGLVAGRYNTGLIAKAATQPAIKLESNNGLQHVRGAVGMLRGDASDSATTAWFINTTANTDLDFVDAEHPGYAVFGRVLTGMDVVDAITGVATKTVESKFLSNAPVAEIAITAATQTQ